MNENLSPNNPKEAIEIEDLFHTLSSGMKHSTPVALCASAAWGVLSVALSPCHLASIPLIVAFIDKQGRTSTRRAMLTSTLFALGILITIALIGVITAMAGRLLGDIGSWGNYLVAILFFLVGFHLLNILPVAWNRPGQPVWKRRGLMSAFLLGLIYGVALGPCTFTFMAPMLGIVFHSGAQHPVYGASLLTMYGIGHCSVIVFAGTFTEVVQQYMDWNESSKGAIILRRICGVLILLGGLLFLYLA